MDTCSELIHSLLPVFYGIDSGHFHFTVGIIEGVAEATAAEANTKLEESVRFMLRKDKELRNTNLKIDADVTKNEVTLSGTVDSDAMRNKAVELAKTVQVGVVVNNKIRVKQGTKNGRSKN